MTDHATPRQRGIIDQMRDLGEEPTFTVALPAPTTGPDDIGAESWGRPIRARRPNQEPPMTEWTLNLTYRKPPLTLNQRGCWAKHDPHRKALRHQAAQLAQAARIPKNLTHITTRLHYRAPDRIRRDEDNLIATAKPLWDGLVDAGIVPDDTSQYMTKLMPIIHPPDGTGPALWLTITHIEEKA